MLFAADENFNGRILTALLDRLPDLDIIRVQDTVMIGASDPILLAWLADKNVFCYLMMHKQFLLLLMNVYMRVRRC